MQLILHIGTDKAGSTAIQQHLSINRDWLHAHSVCVPATGLGAVNGHAALFAQEQPQQLALLVQELAQAAAAGYRAAVLSWEGLCLFSAQEIRHLASLLEAHDVTVLVYVREQADFIQSGLLQQVKSLSNTLPLQAFAGPGVSWQWLRGWRACHHPSRNYYRLLQRWQRGMPGAAMAVRIFAAEHLLHADVVDDFLAQLQLQQDAGFRRLTRPSNTSLDVESALLVEQWQRQGVARLALQCRVDIALSIIAAEGAGEKYFLSAPAVASTRRYYRRGNRQLAQRFLPGMDYPFTLQQPCCRASTPQQIRQRAQLLAARILQLEKTPTLWGPLVTGAELPGAVRLTGGWHDPEDWGAWSSGRHSIIRFRLYRQNILPRHAGVRIFIKGRYYGDNVDTGVTINGYDFSACTLSHEHPGLELLLTQLGPGETVEITLQHRAPISPQLFEGSADPRELAFGIESIGYDFIDGVAALRS